MKVKLEDVHLVSLYTPVDLNGLAGAKSPVVCLMKNFDHALIVIGLSSPIAAGVITVNSCDDIVPTTETAINFPYYRYETSLILANGDVHGVRTWTTTPAAGLIPVATGTPGMYVIDLKAAMLNADDIGFRLCIADPAAASVGWAVAILSGGRFQDANLTSQAVI